MNLYPHALSTPTPPHPPFSLGHILWADNHDNSYRLKESLANPTSPKISGEKRKEIKLNNTLKKVIIVRATELERGFLPITQ